jgi:hypothetical protein
MAVLTLTDPYSTGITTLSTTNKLRQIAYAAGTAKLTVHFTASAGYLIVAAPAVHVEDDTFVLGTDAAIPIAAGAIVTIALMGRLGEPLGQEVFVGSATGSVVVNIQPEPGGNG